VNSHSVVVNSHPQPADAHQQNYHMYPSHDGRVANHADQAHNPYMVPPGMQGNVSMNPYMQANAGLVHNNVGLKSLLPQEVPQQPREGNAYKQSNMTKATIAKEPLYRQAKLANALREMVKTPMSSTTGALHSSYAGQLLHFDDDSSVGSSASHARSLGTSFKQRYNEKMRSVTAR
jgi:hypothetical protein